jgi:hypothetical protein
MTTSLAPFYTHDLQWILALFITKPELYKDHREVRDRQGYFFERFHRFAADYHHFTEDEGVYFGSTRKEAAGEANICGGGGKSTAASSRYFKKRYHAVEESREQKIDRFAKKYGVSFEPGEDARLFVGVKEIWNKLERGIEIIAMSKWSDVGERAYDDATFGTPIPAKLERTLVPFAIRNRALQKHRNLTAGPTGSSSVRRIDADQEEMEYIRAMTVTKCDESPVEVVSNVVFVPPEIDEDDW